MLHDEGSALWGPARKFARQFLLEHDAWCWVKRQNLSQGVAPSAADVFHYYENKALQVEPCGQPRRRTVNKWAARWRARWGVRRACLRSADSGAQHFAGQGKNGQKSRVAFLEPFFG